MGQNNLCKNLLIILLGFLSIGAFFGGIAFIIRPDGSLFQMPVEMLANSPFKDFLIPGIILLLTFGVFPAYVIYGLIKKPESKFFSSLNLLYDHHFAWTFSVYIGVGQVLWINIQTLVLNSVDILHTIFSSLGLLIICIALLPRTRKHYKVSPSGDSSPSYGNRDIII
jgi:hypothetical protein